MLLGVQWPEEAKWAIWRGEIRSRASAAARAASGHAAAALPKSVMNSRRLMQAVI
jgi:hypothetical protein